LYANFFFLPNGFGDLSVSCVIFYFIQCIVVYIFSVFLALLLFLCRFVVFVWALAR